MLYKKPVSVLVVIHTAALDVLLLERLRHPGFWQSVTGSQEDDEALLETARREVEEETGIAVGTADLQDWKQTHRFEIFAEWRDRYAPGVTRKHRACVQPVPSRQGDGDGRTRRAPGLSLAALARSGGGLFFLEQPGCHSGVAGPFSRARPAAVAAFLVGACRAFLQPSRSAGRSRGRKSRVATVVSALEIRFWAPM